MPEMHLVVPTLLFGFPMSLSSLSSPSAFLSTGFHLLQMKSVYFHLACGERERERERVQELGIELEKSFPVRGPLFLFKISITKFGEVTPSAKGAFVRALPLKREFKIQSKCGPGVYESLVCVCARM